MKEWNLVVVRCPVCGTKDKHPMEDQKSIVVECFKCETLFHLDNKGTVRWDVKMEEV